ncbi:amino acid adenylation domain-containing protein [Nocardia sp. NPDC127579]|uniref:amino acid adenylation domain-containing protein n=1 Tax=Nocardia sp. NPDC127579 TaxID=3345402 RepID=UPI003627AC9A
MEQRMPLTAAQVEIWDACRSDPARPMNFASYVDLEGDLDRKMLREAVIAAGIELGSGFVRLENDGDRLWQVVEPRVDEELEYIDFRTAVDPESAGRGWMLRATGQHLDVLTDRLVSMAVLRIGPTRWFWFFRAHHIAMDGFGVTNLLRRTAELYSAEVAGLPREPVSSDELDAVVEYDLAYRGSSRFDTDRDYWLARVSEYQDSIGAAEPTVAAAPVSGVTAAELPADADLHSAALRLNTVDSVLCIAAFAAYHAQVRSTPQVVLSLPVAARTTALLRRSAGIVANEVPLCVRVEHTATVSELLREVQVAVSGALRHQRYRGADIRRDLIESGRLVRGFGPRINVVPLDRDVRLGAANGQVHALSTGPVDDLVVNIYRGAGRRRHQVMFETNPNVYSDQEAHRQHTRFLGFLRRFLASDGDAQVWEVPLTDLDEAVRMVDQWNCTGFEIPEGLVPAMLDAQAARTPNTVAVECGTVSLTHGALAERANQLARYLIEIGVGPESLVALYMRRSVHAMLAMHAVVRAGGAWVSIDPGHPSERSEQLLRATHPVAVLTDSADRAGLPPDVHCVEIDTLDLSEYAKASITDERRTSLRGANTAYVIYTSGSTGEPKAVAVTHSGLINQMRWMRSAFDLNESDVWLHRTSNSFDVSLWGSFLPMLVGARMVLATAEECENPIRLAELIAEHRVTVTDFVPSILDMFLAVATSEQCRTLRRVFAAGEVLSPHTVSAFRTLGSAELHNLYGPTEATIVATHWPVSPAVSTVPIGGPIWNTRVYVLDSRLRPAPVGLPGELYIAGVQLARGYLGRPGTTSDRFVANPFGFGDRLYRTGDRVIWRETDGVGILEYLGRTDFQMKLRGLRIEPGEIETALLSLPAIAQAAVAVRSDTGRGDRLVAYLVPAHGVIDVQQVRSALSAYLPFYLVPAAYVILETFPLNSNGKLDRRALPAPEFEAATFRAPSNPVEEIVASVFAAVLGVHRVGLDDDFFDLGGNSLDAMRVTARLDAALGSRIQVRTLFQAPTPASLAATLSTYSRTGITSIDLGSMARPDPIPLSYAQQRMWFLNRFDPVSVAYNVTAAVRLSGALDVSALRTAVADIVARHEVLRTLYPTQGDGIPHQEIVPVGQAVPDLEVRAVDSSRVMAAVVDVASSVFDVTREVPLRVVLFQVEGGSPGGADAEFVLVTVVHHISCDGSSMAPLTRDLMTAYAARATGAAPGWEPLTVQYADYSVWQRALLGREDDPESLLSNQIGYWKRALAGLPDQLDLPSDRIRPAVQTLIGRSVAVSIDAEIHRGLIELARDEGATLFMVVHTALAVLLARLAGTDDIAIGTPTAGRGAAALDDVIGMFVNTLVFRTQVDPAEAFADLLARQRENDLQVFANADVPFERLVEVLDPIRSRARHPLFQVGLSFQNLTEVGVQMPGLDVTPIVFDTEVSQFDLHWIVADHYDESGIPVGIRGELTYAVGMYDEATAQGFVHRFVRLLEQILAAPHIAVGDIDLLDAIERDRIRSGGNETRDEADSAVTLVSLLDAAVASHPEAVAVVADEASADATLLGTPRWRVLTYAELDDEVNRLARWLIARGIGAEDRVALAIHRSVDLVVAMYAVARTGAAYVPVDASQPRERLEYILTAVAPSCVLTTSAILDSISVSAELDWVAVDVVDVSDRRGDALAPAELVREFGAANTAYVIFTSGSTGRPKGMAIDHAAIVNQLRWKVGEFGLGVDETFLLKTAATFDLSVWEFWSAVACGGRLVVAAPDRQQDPAYLNQLIRDTRVTTLHTVPAMLEGLLTEADGTLGDSLLRVLAIGEALPASLAQRFLRGNTADLFNLYGPTEAAVSITAHRVTSADEASVPIGVPEWNSRIYVLDARLRPVPDGVTGELYVAGVQLARGYVGRAELTADRFVANPFGVGQRMYRTGDLVAWRNGVVEFHGRSDFQVKIRGFRIELGEIEAALSALPEIVHAAVIVKSDPEIGARLVAYVVPTVEAAGYLDIEQLSSAVSALLPSYMVPNDYLILSEFPLTANGKLDRRALPDPGFRVATFRMPTSPMQRIVADVFAETLGITQVGLDDDFFALGGNSLVATRVSARLGTVLDAQVPVRKLFEAPTVLALADALGSLERTGRGVELGRLARPEPLPLSLAQQRMWFLNRFDAGSATYNVPIAVRLTGALDVAALRSAMADLVERHEILRTVYPDTESGPVQVILSATDAVSHLDVLPVAAADVESAVGEVVLRPFDVTTEVPVRSVLFQFDGAVPEYVLVLVVHHIAGDGSSAAPLTRDLMTAYAARTRGVSPGWAPLRVQYADYSVWQRALLGSEDDAGSMVATQLAYWQRALSGLPDQLDLPTDRPRPVVRSFAGGRVELSVDATTHRALIELSRAANTTLFTVVHTALAVLLARLSGGDDIAIGTPVAGRGEPELDDLIGMFVNTVVFRTRIESSEPFDRLLARQRDIDIESIANADVPFERLVELLNPARSTARHPVFQVGLSFQNLALPTLDLPDLTVTGFDIDTELTQFDLHLIATDRYDAADRPRGIDGFFTYATDIFDRDTVQAFVDRFARLLGEITAVPSTPVGDIELLDPIERADLVLARNRTGQALAVGETLVSLLDQTVSAYSKRTALITDDSATMTYADLDVRVNRLARHLISLGVGPESRVALALRRSTDLIVSMYAVAKAGGAYVPIDPDQAGERTKDILDVAAPVCVLTDADAGFVSDAVPTVAVDDLVLDVVDGAPLRDEDRVAPLRASNTAYVIFTSGSTGRPKGVAIDHAAIVNQLRWKVGEFGLGVDETFLLKTAATFDLSVWEFWSAVACGGRLVVAAPDRQQDPEYLNELMRRERVTLLHAVPSMLDVLTVGAFPTSIRRVLSIGEALPGSLAQRLLRHNSPIELFNLYGPTEAAVSITAHQVIRADSASPPIGSPEWNSQVYVLDARLRPVPEGVCGELYVAGTQLARGYLGRADLTAERFVANPFGAGTRMYRTGDLVVWRSGALEFRGRTDFQVKIRGFRIELGEVDAVLATHQDVDFVVTVGCERHSGATVLVSYVCVGRDCAPDPAALIAFAARRLPSYMVPTAVVVLDEPPLTPVGKLDRSALPPPVFAATTYRAPTTSAEQLVASIFAEVLAAERVGMDDDFFSLGGNSLIATRVIGRLSAAMGIRYPIRLLFEAPTVAGLAEQVMRYRGARSRPPLIAGPYREPIPLSPPQQRMWLLNRVNPGLATYNIPVAIRLTGALDIPALESAVTDVVTRHEVLRTRYPEQDGRARQQILPPTRIEFEPEVVIPERLSTRIGELVTQGFDVTVGAPVRAVLLELAADSEWVLVFVLHHISADGWSMGLLSRDFMLAYAARATGMNPDWAPMPVQFADCARWHRELLGSPADPGSLAAAQLAFWSDELAGLPEESTFAGDHPRPPESSYAGATVHFTLDAATADGLRAVAERYRVTMFMVVQTGLAVLLARLTDSRDVAIGTPVAGRSEVEMDSVIGMFVNTLVLRARIDPAESVAALLLRQRDVAVAAFANADVPFDAVVDALAPPRVPARSPLFQVALAFQNLPRVDLALPGVRAQILDVPSPTEKFDLTVTVDDSAEGDLPIAISYSTDLFDEPTIRRVGDRLLRVLTGIVADSAQSVADIDVFLDGERDQILRQSSRPGIGEQDDATLVDLIDAQCRATPDSNAVRAGSTTLTYAELSEKADRVAHHLAGCGVGPGDLVAVALERTVDIPIALLAVLRVGAAYLPIDPAYPSGRLEFVLADAGPSCVLTADRLRAELPVGNTPVVLVESVDDTVNPAFDRPVAHPDDLAYVIYTSGSTGTPKGVAVTHRNVVHLLTNALPLFEAGSADVWTVFHSFAFDFAVWELWGALSTGGMAVIVDHITSRSPDLFGDLLIRERVTMLSQTPSAFGQFSEAVRGTGLSALTLRYVVLGGEAVDSGRMRDWYSRYGTDTPRVVNLYGITETTVHVTICELDEWAATSSSRTVGLSLPGVGVHILDSRVRVAPTGVDGEIYVAGAQVARGYRGRPGLTATRFVANPFGPPGSRMYRSGDLGRWGIGLEYLGRADRQVQLRGFRIEPGEIEAVLAALESIAEAKVISRGNRLLAYVRASDEFDTAQVYRQIAVHLPAHMIPAAVTPVTTWPLTVNGKLDIEALPEPDFTARGTGRAPRTEHESTVAALFAEVLGVPAVGIDDDFFTLGGDSLSAVRLRARFREVLGMDLTVQQIFEARTVAALVGVPVRRDGLPARAGIGYSDPIPLAFPQRRLLELNEYERRAPGPGRAYVMSLRFTEPVSPQVVRQAQSDLVVRHEILRTVFPGIQRVLPGATIDFASVVADEIPAAIAADIGLPFDVRVEVPLRIRCYSGAESSALLIMLHHIAADGWSAAPLIQDFATALHARGEGTAPQWQPLPIQYAAHAAWQQEILQLLGTASPIDTQLAYWTAALEHLPEVVPALRRRPGVQPEAGQVYLGVDEEKYRCLAAFANAHDTSVYMVVHTAYALMLTEFGLGCDLAICAPTAGRTEPGMEAAIGRFTNFLVIRTDVAGAPAFPDLLARVRQTTLAALDNQDIPFEFLADHLGIRPRLRLRLAFQNIPAADLDRAGLAAHWVPVASTNPADFDVSLILSEVQPPGRAQSLWGVLEYAADVIDAGTAEKMKNRFEEIMVEHVYSYR